MEKRFGIDIDKVVKEDWSSWSEQMLDEQKWIDARLLKATALAGQVVVKRGSSYRQGSLFKGEEEV